MPLLAGGAAPSGLSYIGRFHCWYCPLEVGSPIQKCLAYLAFTVRHRCWPRVDTSAANLKGLRQLCSAARYTPVMAWLSASSHHPNDYRSNPPKRVREIPRTEQNSSPDQTSGDGDRRTVCRCNGGRGSPGDREDRHLRVGPGTRAHAHRCSGIRSRSLQARLGCRLPAVALTRLD